MKTCKGCAYNFRNICLLVSGSCVNSDTRPNFRDREEVRTQQDQTYWKFLVQLEEER